MDWAAVVVAIIGILVAMVIPMALAARKRGAAGKLTDFHQHLQHIGIRASIVEEEASREGSAPRRAWGERAEGVIRIEGKNVDSVTIIGVSTRHGVTYYLDYLARQPAPSAAEARKKTSMVKKRSPPLWGKAVDIRWKGDPGLAQRLNLDYQLKYRLLHPGPDPLKGGISIRPEPKHGYTAIRTDYQLPSRDVFEAIDAIAKHVKTGF